MQQPKNRQTATKKKPNLLQNPQLTTAQMTLAAPSANKLSANTLQIDPIQVLSHAQLLWIENDNVEAINLLKGLEQYLKGIKFSNQQVLLLVSMNLGICYYKIGFLEQSRQQFQKSLSMVKNLQIIATIAQQSTQKNINKNITMSTIQKKCKKIKYNMLHLRILLQICILYSELSKHQIALQYSKNSCKLAYNIIYDIQIIQYQYYILKLSKNLQKNKINEQKQLLIQPNTQNMINNINIINKLINLTKDIKLQYISRQKQQLYIDIIQSYNRIQKIEQNIENINNLQKLYELKQDNIDILWVYKNKILDQIQMKFTKQNVYTIDKFWKNNQIIEKIIYLIISLYCYSTQTRFIQKHKQNQDPSVVLDSQHWLSRALQIAYTFIPHESPILNQILTVHDRFHGIDKQTIPQDKQVSGFFKVLRPLIKPKSVYNSKNSMYSPIMIRIQMPKIAIQIKQTQNQQQIVHHNISDKSSNTTKIHNDNIKTIQFDNLTKNNKIRGLLSSKKYQLSEMLQSQSTIKYKNGEQSHSHSNVSNLNKIKKIEFQQNLKSIYMNVTGKRKINTPIEIGNKNMKINIKNLGNLDQSETQVKSMRRPHSYDKQIDKTEQPPYPIKTQRRKRASSLKKQKQDSKQFSRQKQKRKRSVTSNNSNSTCLKLDGLQMLPNPFRKTNHNDQDDTFQFTSLGGKLSQIQATKVGGNIFISNNINLYISKETMQDHQNMNRQKQKIQKAFNSHKQSKRQNYINKRKISNSNLTELRNPQFML